MGLAPTLNRLGRACCLVSIGDWAWSTSTVCGAWRRGAARASHGLAAELERREVGGPLCLQCGRLKTLDVDLEQNLYTSERQVFCFF